MGFRSKRKREKVTYNYQCSLTAEEFVLTEKAAHPKELLSVKAFYEMNPDRIEMSRSKKGTISIKFPLVVVHSANPIGSANIMGYINNFLMNENKPQTCIRVNIDHTV
jgi:hypothetical protein